MALAYSNTHISITPLRAEEFDWLSRFLNARTGIILKDGKQAMVMGRLEKRLRLLNLNNYGDYFRRLGMPGEETETRLAIDLLTTNETYFFREPQHFDFLRTQLLPKHPLSKTLRIWSAASSSGEEAYTLALLLAEYLPSKQWEIIGTDISSRVLEKAREGLYQLSAAEKIPPVLLKKYCLRGRDEYEGFLLIDPILRKQVKFQHANLVEDLPELGMFDIIFLRNVMIYFEQDTKQRVIERLYSRLLPGGHFIISHSESLNGLKTPLKMLMPSVYQKPL
ncbi:MAG: CheR family methyltransferase [Methylococcaceae bacterium]